MYIWGEGDAMVTRSVVQELYAKITDFEDKNLLDATAKPMLSDSQLLSE